jgi:tetratricopeptide (TPR) repeat protein
MKLSMRLAISLLAMILFVTACASVPKTQSPQPQEPQDLSEPTLASLYYFMIGTYLNLEGNYPVADQVFTLALAQDPASFTIRKAYYNNSMLWFLLYQDQEAEQRVRDMLDLARASYDFDEEMLHLAYAVYDILKDEVGLNWVLQRLMQEYPSARVYVWEYMRQRRAGVKPQTALLEKALHEPGIREDIKLMIAAQYADHQPSKAIDILRESERNLMAEELLLQLYLAQSESSALQAHFDTYQYPQDKEKIQQYLNTLQGNGCSELALTHWQGILATSDADLIETISIMAFLSANTTIQQEIQQYLQNKTPAPAEDGAIAAMLLLHSIAFPEFTLADGLTERIYQLSDLTHAIYNFAYQKEYQGDRENDYKTAFADLHQAVLEALPPSEIRDYMAEHSAYMAGKTENSTASSVKLAQHLIAKGFGGHDEFMMLLQHYHDQDQNQEQIELLRVYLQRYPTTVWIKNDLGYRLLDYPEHWDEAERLISAALSAEPENVSYLDSMAWLHYLKKEYQAAQSYLPKMLKDDSESAELLYHAGMISLAAGDPSAASEYFRQALEAKDTGDYHEQSRQQLELLSPTQR